MHKSGRQIEKMIYPFQLFTLFLVIWTCSALDAQVSDSASYTAQLSHQLDSLEKEIKQKIYSDSAGVRSLINQYVMLATRGNHEAKVRSMTNYLGQLYLAHENYDSLQVILDRSLPMALETKDSVLAAALIRLEGLRHYYLGNFSEGIQSYLSNIDLARAAGSSMLAGFYNNIGICYEKLKDYTSAIKYYELALDNCRKSGYVYGIQVMTNNMAVIYLNEKKWEKAYNLLHPICDTMTGPGTNHLHLDLGHGYARALFGLGRIDESISIGEKYLAIAQSTGDKKREILHLLGLGDRFKDSENPAKAIIYYEDALHKMQDIGINEQMVTVVNNLRVMHKKVGQYQKALQYSDQLHELKDSMYNKQDLALVRELDKKYQSSLKDQELLRQEIELTEKERKYNLLLFIIGGILITGLFIYKNQEKNKRLAEQDLQLAEQHIATLESRQKIENMSSMIAGQEAERQRIAKDLHDGLGTLLTTVKGKIVQIQTAIDELSSANIYESAQDMIDQACEEVRRISHNMMPGVLRLEGLQGAVEDIVTQLEQTHGLQVFATIDFDDQRVNEVQAHMIYRILQEGINNIVRHSHATEVVIQLMEYDDHLHLLIEDDGDGFDIEKQASGLGLQSIRSRVAFLNGDLDINSNKEGTSMHINVAI